jgi:hypothetical protein
MQKHMSYPRAIAVGFCAAAVLFVSTGCVSGPKTTQSAAMVPISLQIAKQQPVSVIVHAIGECETKESYLRAAELSVISFREALVAAIKESRVFTSVRDQPPADYSLEVSIVNIQSGCVPLTSNSWKRMDWRTTVSARWQLTRISDSSVVFNDFVFASENHTYSSKEDNPLCIALENAARENIKLGLEKLSELNLPVP